MPSDAVLPSLQPLLMALRDERYTHVEELNIWSLPLKQKDVVELVRIDILLLHFLIFLIDYIFI